MKANSRANGHSRISLDKNAAANAAVALASQHAATKSAADVEQPTSPMQRLITALEVQRNGAMSQAALAQAEAAHLGAALDAANKRIAELEAAAKA